MIQKRTKELDERIQELTNRYFGLESGLDPEFKEKWIKALISGEYNQVDGYLHYKDKNPNNTSYCCLGVACVITGKYDLNTLIHISQIDDLGEKISDFPQQLKPFVSPCKSSEGIKSADFANRCMALNDEVGFSFREIAYWLEHYVDVEKN